MQVLSHQLLFAFTRQLGQIIQTQPIPLGSRLELTIEQVSTQEFLLPRLRHRLKFRLRVARPDRRSLKLSPREISGRHCTLQNLTIFQRQTFQDLLAHAEAPRGCLHGAIKEHLGLRHMFGLFLAYVRRQELFVNGAFVASRLAR